MLMKYGSEGSYSTLAVRIAALLLISNNEYLLSCLGEELKNETTCLLEIFRSFPDNLGKVLAWEALT